MANYIDVDYVKDYIGSDEVNALTGNDDTVLTDRMIPDGQSIVDSVLDSLGYAVPLDSAPNLVKLMTLGAIVQPLFSRKQLESRANLMIAINVFENVRLGHLKIPSLKPKDSKFGFGGTKFTGNGKVFGKKLRNNF